MFATIEELVISASKECTMQSDTIKATIELVDQNGLSNELLEILRQANDPEMQSSTSSQFVTPNVWFE